MGILYLIQPCEYIGTSKFKIGVSRKCSIDRIKDYKSNCRVLYIFNVDDVFKIEELIKTEFKKKFSLFKGKEWFEGEEDKIKTEFVSIYNQFLIMDKPIINFSYYEKKFIESPSDEIINEYNNHFFIYRGDKDMVYYKVPHKDFEFEWKKRELSRIPSIESEVNGKKKCLVDRHKMTEVAYREPMPTKGESYLVDSKLCFNTFNEPYYNKEKMNMFLMTCDESIKIKCHTWIDFHMRNIICDNINDFNYLKNWISSCLLDNSFNPTTWIVLVGENGSGKTSFVEKIFKNWFGRSYMMNNGSNLLGKGSFKDLDKKSFCLFDEMNNLKGSDYDYLKSIITSDNITIEKKHKDPKEVKNNLRGVICCNTLFNLPVTERRFAVYTLKSDKVRNNEYFDTLYNNDWRYFASYFIQNPHKGIYNDYATSYIKNRRKVASNPDIEFLKLLLNDIEFIEFKKFIYTEKKYLHDLFKKFSEEMNIKNKISDIINKLKMLNVIKGESRSINGKTPYYKIMSKEEIQETINIIS